MSLDISWWALPGPSRFLDQVEQDLRNGKCVVLSLPKLRPSGLKDALARRVSESASYTWSSVEELRSSDGLSAPLEVLRDQFSWAFQRLGVLTVADFSRTEGLERYVICVDGFGNCDLDAWQAFMLDFEHASRNLRGDHPRFIYVGPGLDPESGVLGAAGISVRKWRGIVDAVDNWTLVWPQFRHSGMSPFHRRLSASLCVELAGPDPELAVHLARFDLGSLLNPMSVLRGYAKERGWEGATEASWESGTSDELDGMAVTHTALLAARGELAEIVRLVWRAEVGVAFPLLEQWRASLAVSMARWIRLPLETPFGVISDRNDLELSHLLHVSRRSGAPRESVRLLEKLCRVRHALAHLEPAPVEDLLDAAIARVPSRSL